MRRSAPLVAILLAAASGCSGDAGSGPPVVPVHGRVTLDGQPLAYKTLLFVPEAGTPGMGAGGSTKEDGRYSLLAVRPGATKDVGGIAPGSYAVVVTEPMIPPGAKPHEESRGEPGPAIAVSDRVLQKKSPIPPPYTRRETTKLHVTVPPKGGAIDLELTTRP